MPHDSDIEMDEMMEEMAEDLGRDRERETNNYRPGGRINISTGWPFLIGGLGLVILIAVVLSFLLKGEAVSEGDLESITNGLERIEKRLGNLEQIEVKIMELEKETKAFKSSISEWQRFKTSFDRRLKVLSNNMKENQAKLTASMNRQRNSTTSSSVSSTASGRYHIVKKGETLYRISQRYGLKIDELQRINKLKPDDEIYPDQKLLITP